MLRLRPFKPMDAEVIVSWIRDEVMFRQWCADRFGQYPISPQDLIGHYRQMEQEDWFFPFTSFDETGPAGHLILRFTDERKETLRVGFVITDLNRRSQGIGRELLRLALKMAFEILHAEKVTLGVFANNPAAIRCYASAGFHPSAGAEAECYSILGQQWDCLEMEQTAAEFRAGSIVNRQDMCVPCGDGLINIRAGAIIQKQGRLLMIGNDRSDYLYSIGGRLRFHETAEEAVKREVREETGVELEIERLGFVHENRFRSDLPGKEGVPVYEISFFFYMKVPQDFSPVSGSHTEDGVREYLRWVDPEEPVKLYPEFFRRELNRNRKGVRHIVTQEGMKTYGS